MAGGRPLRIAWQHTAAAVEAAYRRERDGIVRSRLQALWLVRQGHSLRDVAATVGVHYRTLQDWLRWYRQGGLAVVGQHRRAGKGRAGWLTAAQQAALAAEAATGQFFTAVDAVRWVETQFGVRYQRSGMYSLLERLGCHPKVPRPFNPRSTAAEQTAWKKGGSPTRSGRRASAR